MCYIGDTMQKRLAEKEKAIIRKQRQLHSKLNKMSFEQLLKYAEKGSVEQYEGYYISRYTDHILILVGEEECVKITVVTKNGKIEKEYI